MYQTPTVQSATALPQGPASEQTRACLSRYTADLLELLETNYSISPACFSHPPTAAQLLRGEWGQLLEELEGGHSYPKREAGTAEGAEESWFTSGQPERMASLAFIIAKVSEKGNSLEESMDHNEA